MQSRSKNYTAYLCAVSLLFSYAELIFPRVLPFLKPGFSNIAVLLALSLDLKSFVLLIMFKSIAGSFIQGILFSPFFQPYYFRSKRNKKALVRLVVRQGRYQRCATLLRDFGPLITDTIISLLCYGSFRRIILRHSPFPCALDGPFAWQISDLSQHRVSL